MNAQVASVPDKWQTNEYQTNEWCGLCQPPVKEDRNLEWYAEYTTILGVCLSYLLTVWLAEVFLFKPSAVEASRYPESVRAEAMCKSPTLFA